MAAYDDNGWQDEEEDDNKPLMEPHDSGIDSLEVDDYDDTFEPIAYDLVGEYTQRSEDACCKFQMLCLPDCSYYCIGCGILTWWISSGFIVMVITICYFNNIIQCSPAMDQQFHGGCTFVDIYAVTIFIFQILCIFVSILALVSLHRARSKYLIPTIWYCILQVVIAAVASLFYLASGIVFFVIVSLELFVFYRNYKIVCVTHYM